MNKKIWINLSIILMALFASQGFSQEVSSGGATACWLDSYGRGTGQIPGRVADCPDGYINIGFNCFSPLESYVAPSRPADCPRGTNIGLFCLYWGGFLGVIPYMDNTGAMTCRANEFLNPGVGRCYPNCNPGFTSTGEFCSKGLDLLGPSSMTCKAGEVKCGAQDARCCPDTSAGGECGGGDKDKTGTYILGGSLIAAGAATVNPLLVIGGITTLLADVALCYDKCGEGYKGIGPVCWGKCPPELPFSCGAMCTDTEATCGLNVFGQVASVGALAANVVTFGQATKAKIAGQSAIKAGQAAEKVVDTAAEVGKLKQLYQTSVNTFNTLRKNSKLFDRLVKVGKAAGKYGLPGLVVAGTAGELVMTENITPEDIIRGAAQIAELADPTGIAGVVGAFTYATCSKKFANRPKAGADQAQLSCQPLPSDPKQFIIKTSDGQCMDDVGNLTAAMDKCLATEKEICEFLINPDDTAAVPETKAAEATPVAAEPPKPDAKGFCHEDPANRGYYILKTEDKPGWAKGDFCHGLTGKVEPYGGKPCEGGSQQECLALIATEVYKIPASALLGYCYEDPGNRGWYILKTEDKPGWGPGDFCHGQDGKITPYGQKPCKGGGLSTCQDWAAKLKSGRP